MKAGTDQDGNGAVLVGPRPAPLPPLTPEAVFYADAVQAQYPDAEDPAHLHWSAAIRRTSC